MDDEEELWNNAVWLRGPAFGSNEPPLRVDWRADPVHLMPRVMAWIPQTDAARSLVLYCSVSFAATRCVAWILAQGYTHLTMRKSLERALLMISSTTVLRMQRLAILRLLIVKGKANPNEVRGLERLSSDLAHPHFQPTHGASRSAIKLLIECGATPSTLCDMEIHIAHSQYHLARARILRVRIALFVCFRRCCGIDTTRDWMRAYFRYKTFISHYTLPTLAAQAPHLHFAPCAQSSASQSAKSKTCGCKGVAVHLDHRQCAYACP